MEYRRSYHTLTVLPDGKVLATGGQTATDGVDQTTGILATEIWDPDTDTWTTTASHRRPRLYHSSSILLPDGRVMLAGGGAFGNAKNEKSAEIYSPPYLFKGPRPTVTGAPNTLDYGQQFTVNTPDASRIQSASLVRMGSVTHNIDMDQRFMNLRVQNQSGSVRLDGPANANVAPPGWYMVFLIDDQGVPSVGQIVKVQRAPDTQAPTVPANLTATRQSASSVGLSWSPATDNTGVTEYRVHRSTTAGFTPSAANRIATVTSGTSHQDTGLAPGTYYYRVTAADGAGNTSSPSNQAIGDLAPDTQAPTSPASLTAARQSASSVALGWAAATDNVGVTEYRVHRSTTAGFTVSAANRIATVTSGTSYQNTGLAAGTYHYRVVAADAAGNASAPSNQATGDLEAPTVSITAPAAGANVSNGTTIAADAADAVGVQSVQFRVDGVNLGAADTTSPYSIPWDTLSATNGSHTLSAVVARRRGQHQDLGEPHGDRGEHRPDRGLRVRGGERRHRHRQLGRPSRRDLRGHPDPERTDRASAVVRRGERLGDGLPRGRPHPDLRPDHRGLGAALLAEQLALGGGQGAAEHPRLRALRQQQRQPARRPPVHHVRSGELGHRRPCRSAPGRTWR